MTEIRWRGRGTPKELPENVLFIPRKIGLLCEFVLLWGENFQGCFQHWVGWGEVGLRSGEDRK